MVLWGGGGGREERVGKESRAIIAGGGLVMHSCSRSKTLSERQLTTIEHKSPFGADGPLMVIRREWESTEWLVWWELLGCRGVASGVGEVEMGTRRLPMRLVMRSTCFTRVRDVNVVIPLRRLTEDSKTQTCTDAREEEWGER